MKNIIYIFVLIFALSVTLFGQERDSIAPKINLTTIAQVSQGESYFTFPTDIGNIEPLVFEANLNTNFYIRTSKDARLIGVLTAQIILRMYQENSLPVRTPSYIPQLTAYYRLSAKPNINSLSLMSRIAHHSNGQEGEFYLENGEINTKSGNFSTNYIELGLVKTNFNKRFHAAQFFSSSFEWHPKALTYEELIGKYSLYRWNTIFSIFKLPIDKYNKNKKASISIKGKTTWMFGDVYDWDFFNVDRLNINLTFFYHPKFLEDIGLFAQFYHGMDYYNIYFSHQITVLRFGIMTEKLNF